jgi:phosphonate transport system permease protein
MEFGMVRRMWPPHKHRLTVIGFLLLLLLTLGISVIIGFNPVLLFTEWPFAVAFLGELFPPNFTYVFRKPEVWISVFSTIAMAFLGTLIGGFISLSLAFFAARNVSPRPWLSVVVYTLFTLERVIPSFIILLVFLIMVGIGPFAGTLTLIVSTIGTFGKLFAESMEQVEPGVLESVRSTGATRLQWIRYGLLPEAVPSILSNFFYSFDVNIRRAIGLGIFGGGGLGFDLYLAMGMMEYRSALALMLVIVALVFFSERISTYFRNRMMWG